MCRHSKKHSKLLQNVLCFVLQGEPGLAGPQGLKGEKGERVRVILKLIAHCSTLPLDLAGFKYIYYRGNLDLLLEEVYRAVKENQESQGSL